MAYKPYETLTLKTRI